MAYTCHDTSHLLGRFLHSSKLEFPLAYLLTEI